MQEEVESRTFNLMVSTTKLTARTVASSAMKFLRHYDAMKSQGKQSVKRLIGQNRGVTNMDISKTDLKGFERVARKYGVDYAIRKDGSVQPPKYLVFFKAQDADALKSAMQEYAAAALHRTERPSLLKQLEKVKALAASLPGKVRSKEHEGRSL